MKFEPMNPAPPVTRSRIADQRSRGPCTDPLSYGNGRLQSGTSPREGRPWSGPRSHVHHVAGHHGPGGPAGRHDEVALRAYPGGRALERPVGQVDPDPGPDGGAVGQQVAGPVSYTHLRAHETGRTLVC